MTSPSDPQWQGQPGQRPPPGYGPPPQQGSYPPPGYGQQRPPGYGQPPAGYEQAPAGYGQQQPGYGPPPGYGQQVGYGAVPPGAPGLLPEWWERLVARIIDGVILGIIGGVIGSILTGIIVSSATTAAGVIGGLAVTYIVLGLLYTAYDFFLHSRNGQTVGKMVMKTRVVMADGRRPDQATLAKRALLYPGWILVGGIVMLVPILGGIVVFALAIFSLVDVIFILTDSPLRRALHDKWTNTIVVKAQ